MARGLRRTAGVRLAECSVTAAAMASHTSRLALFTTGTAMSFSSASMTSSSKCAKESHPSAALDPMSSS